MILDTLLRYMCYQKIMIYTKDKISAEWNVELYKGDEDNVPNKLKTRYVNSVSARDNVVEISIL